MLINLKNFKKYGYKNYKYFRNNEVINNYFNEYSVFNNYKFLKYFIFLELIVD